MAVLHKSILLIPTSFKMPAEEMRCCVDMLSDAITELRTYRLLCGKHLWKPAVHVPVDFSSSFCRSVEVSFCKNVKEVKHVDSQTDTVPEHTNRIHFMLSYGILSVFHKAINLLPANTQIREIQVFLESVLEEKAGRKRFDQVLKSLLQAEFLRVCLLVNNLAIDSVSLKCYSVFSR